MKKILIADNQPDVRSALRFLLEQQPSVNVVGETENSNELITFLKKNKADVVLLDWELSGTPSEIIIPKLRTIFPEVAIVVLDSKPQTKNIAINVGAAGFVSKNEPPDRLLEVIYSANGKENRNGGRN